MVYRASWTHVPLGPISCKTQPDSSTQSLPLSPDVKNINPNGVAALAKDVHYLVDFVESLGVPILRENLDELQQTVSLMQADNSDEYYDVSTRNKKYGRVHAMNGPLLLEKYETPCLISALAEERRSTADHVTRLTYNVQSPPKVDKYTTLSSRFGMK